MAYCVTVILGISLPSQTIPPLNTLKDYYYIQYPFLLVPSGFIGEMFRFEAIYDEPGVVGTISGILLLLRGLNLKKWDTYPILISGILSLSLAFYLMLFTYVLFFQSIKAKMVTITTLIVFAFYFYNNEFVNERLFERLKIENGQLVGVNRTTGTIDSFMNTYVTSEKFWWGYGEKYAQRVVNRGGASYKDLIVDYGILGFSLFVLITLIKGIKELGMSRMFVIFLIIFIFIVYQRPFIFSLIYFFLIYTSN